MVRKIKELWWFLFLLAILSGELASWRLVLFNLSFRLRFLDLVVISLLPISGKWWIKKSKTFLEKAYFFFLVFLFVNELIQSYLLFHANLSGLLFLFHLIVYLLSGWYLVFHPPSIDWLKKLSWGMIFISFFQYLFLRQIAFYNLGGWDPHAYRLFGSLFDPNFFGLIIFSLYLIWNELSIRNDFFVFVFLALSFLTFSRTVYFLLIFYFLIKILFYKSSFSKKQLLVVLLGFSLVLIMAFNLHGEGVKLWRLSTLKARWQELKISWQIFSQHPFFGIGFNNIGLYKLYFLFMDKSSHSFYWFSSLVSNFLVTSGIIGLFIFVLLWLASFLTSEPLGRMIMFLFTFHSLFHNSFFYSFTLIFFFLTLAIIKEYSKPS